MKKAVWGLGREKVQNSGEPWVNFCIKNGKKYENNKHLPKESLKEYKETS